MTREELIQNIREILHKNLTIKELNIQDNSHRHENHPTNPEKKAHLKLTIVAEEFSKLSLLTRHRLIQQLLTPLIPQEIHALSLQTYSPFEKNN